MTNLQKFQDLGLSEKTLKALEKKGFEEPSEIQAQIIPLLLENQRDIIGQSYTGSGKTAAFGLPLIERLKPEGYVQVLILVPTRELAIQVSEEINSLQTEKKLRVIPVYGGQSYDIQLNAFKRGVDIVVGTPGRIIDHLKRKTLKVEQISNLILDEADEMLNMGFVDDIEEILKSTNKDKRVLLFSATMPREILQVAKKYMKDYELVAVKSAQMTATNTDQIYFEVAEKDKLEALSRIVDMEPNFYGIVFCKTKLDVDFVSGKFIERGYQAQALHGDVQQKQRERILASFKSKKTMVLIATDVAARGIDVNDITHVINYSLPQDPESYVHRVGRTGRAGKKGTAITFVTPSEYRKIVFFQRVTKTDIKKGQIPNVENIIEMKKSKLTENIKKVFENDDWKKYSDIAKDLLTEVEPEKVVASLLNLFYKNELDPKNYKDIQKANSSVDNTGKARLFIALGKNDGYTPFSMVDYITAETGVKGTEIDEVSILESFSFITVPFVEAEIILQIFSRKSSGGRSLVSKAKERDGGGSSSGRSGGSRGGYSSGGRSGGSSYGNRSGGSSSGYSRGGSSSGGRSGGSSYGNRSEGSRGGYSNYGANPTSGSSYSSKPRTEGSSYSRPAAGTGMGHPARPMSKPTEFKSESRPSEAKPRATASRSFSSKESKPASTTTDKPKRSIIKKIFG